MRVHRLALLVSVVALASPRAAAIGPTLDTTADATAIGVGTDHRPEASDRAVGSLGGTIRSNELAAGAVHVVLYRGVGLWDTVRSTVANPDGGYVFEGLSPERYRVRVLDSRGRYQATWANDQLTQSRAEVFVVQVGTKTVVDVNLQPRPPGSITGTITASTDDIPGAGISVQVVNDDGLVAGGRTDEQGAFRVKGIPAGSYRVRFADQRGRFPAEWYPDSATSADAELIIVEAEPIELAVHMG